MPTGHAVHALLHLEGVNDRMCVQVIYVTLNKESVGNYELKSKRLAYNAAHQVFRQPVGLKILHASVRALLLSF